HNRGKRLALFWGRVLLVFPAPSAIVTDVWLLNGPNRPDRKEKSMTRHLQHCLTASFVALALGLPVFAEKPTAPRMPAAIQVPAGNTSFLTAQAVGTQNYVCLPSGNSFSWTFFGPQATLFLTLRFSQAEIRQQIATHFLSPNPSESGMPRATWQS